MNNPAKATGVSIWAALIAIYIVWGSTYLAIRFAVETMPPFLAAGFRFLIAGAVLYAFRRLRGDPTPLRIEWRSAAIVGLFLLVGGNGGVMWAEQRVASGIASLMIASVPLWMALLDSLRPGGRRPNSWVVVGVLAGFAGILVLIGPAQLIGIEGEVDLLGALVLLLAAFFWAVGSLYNRGARLPDSPLLATGMEMLAGSLGLLILGTVTGEWGQLDLAAISTRSWLGFAFLVVFGSWVGFASYIWLLRVAPTMLVSTYAYVNPLVAILLGSLLAGEELTARVLLAAVFILGSVVLITLKQPAIMK
ncbi:MAG TPA: EamA family transporter, partial [Anaerolineales bacterium]|nr:EamA family transporter [Anaerolineales bacterium]